MPYSTHHRPLTAAKGSTKSMLQPEPQIAPPIEDQILEAIISASLPAASDGFPLSTRDAALGTAPPLLTSSPAHLFTSSISPLALASRFHLPLSKVLDILASPLTRTRLAAAQELRDLAFHQREQSARQKALTALENILDTTEDPIEKRRAATAILRRNSARNPFWPRIPGSASAGATTLDDDEDLDEDAAPPRAKLPEPDHPRWTQPARTNLIRLLTRLQDNHNPEPDSGLTTLFNHKHDPKNLCGDERFDAIADYLEDPGQDAELTGFSCAILHPPEPIAPGTPLSPASSDPGKPAPHYPAIERVTLHWPDYHRTVRFHFINDGNIHVPLWKITHIDIGPEDKSTPDSS
jgi:hypothetical protein